jgi:hypothetical protein
LRRAPRTEMASGRLSGDRNPTLIVFPGPSILASTPT